MSDDTFGEDYPRVWRRISKWTTFRSNLKEPWRYNQLREDLWVIRNPDHKNAKGRINKIPAELIDSDEQVNADVEHYFICRSWVGCGVYPLSEVEALTRVYNAGKRWGLTPQSNPNKPVTPPTERQRYFQLQGMNDGYNDGQRYGTLAGSFSWSMPDYYY